MSKGEPSLTERPQSYFNVARNTVDVSFKVDNTRDTTKVGLTGASGHHALLTTCGPAHCTGATAKTQMGGRYWRIPNVDKPAAPQSLSLHFSCHSKTNNTQPNCEERAINILDSVSDRLDTRVTS